MSLNPTKPVIDYEAIRSTARKSWWPDGVLAGVVGTLAAANLLAAISQWPSYDPFGAFAILWFCLGVASIPARFGGCRWASVFASLALSAVGFCINAHFLAEITASC